MDDDRPSRIYITNENNESRFVEVYVGDGPSTAHLGGIQFLMVWCIFVVVVRLVLLL